MVFLFVIILEYSSKLSKNKKKRNNISKIDRLSYKNMFEILYTEFVYVWSITPNQSTTIDFITKKTFLE